MATIWELDFYSRPVLDDAGKKRWELVICESPQRCDRAYGDLFRFTQFCPADQVNSIWLQGALEAAIAQAPQPPDKVRFFRQQMTNMITRACENLALSPLPSRRTYALNYWLQERFATVYPQMEGYQASQVVPTASVITANPKAPQLLPDALVGDRWAFVNLDFAALAEMSDWEINFGEAFPLELVNLPNTTQIPGLLIFSSRALPIAGWMSGIELAFVTAELQPKPQLIIDTGASDRWIMARLANSNLQAEAQNFEHLKQQAQGVHFLAVQSAPESQTFAGFWLLQALNLA